MKLYYAGAIRSGVLFGVCLRVMWSFAPSAVSALAIMAFMMSVLADAESIKD